jgi:protein O-GlcNAc transferase
MSIDAEALRWIEQSAALCGAGDRRGAADALRQAVAIQPNVASWHCDLAVLLQTTGRGDEAELEYRRAVACDSGLRQAWYNLGCLLNEQDREGDAIECFQQSLRLEPNHAAAHHNLGQALFNLGHTDEAIAHYRRSISLGGGAKPETMLALAIGVSPTAAPREVLETRRRWSQSNFPSQPLRRHPAEPSSAALAVSRVVPQEASPHKLRLAYLSAYFDYPNWMKPVWPVINRHERDRFELFLYSDGCQNPPAGYQPHQADHFHLTASLDNAALARRIADDQIDVLVDLNGFSRVQRMPLFALRPAKVNVGWFNIFATTGMDAFDYLIGDAVVLAPDDEPDYCEKLIRLNGCYLAFEVGYPVPAVAALPCLLPYPSPPTTLPQGERGERRRPFTFGSLASLYKLTPQVVAVWSRILDQTPSSRLLLRNQGLRSSANRRHLSERFARHGIAADRLVLLGPTDHDQFLQTYDEIDLALDPWPYNGGTTTSEALWQGVPVASIRGDRWTSRVSASLLAAAGLSDFIAADAESLVKLAVAAASDPHRLANFRAEMRERLRSGAACDSMSLTRQLEAAYEAARLQATGYRLQEKG